MDSLPEIEDAPDYIAFIGDRADIFLSLNQESGNNRSGFSQHIVSTLCDRDDRFRRSRAIPIGWSRAT